jgi:hypothetical protein
MSRSTAGLVAALLGFSLLILFWDGFRDTAEPPPPEVSALEPGDVVAEMPKPPASTATQAAPAAKTEPRAARLRSRADLEAVLEEQGLNPAQALARYQDWRVANGFLGPDALAGIDPGSAPVDTYQAMDTNTLKSMADAGDVAAMQVYAGTNLPRDPFTALRYLGRASEAGSAAAALEIAALMRSLATVPTADAQGDPEFARRLLELRGGQPDADLREDALAWTLTALRQAGPLAGNAEQLAWMKGAAAELGPERLLAACTRSLGILGDLAARRSAQGWSAPTLPPAFIAEDRLYDDLPCNGTPAAVVPPREMSACRKSPITDGAGQARSLWICPPN